MTIDRWHLYIGLSNRGIQKPMVLDGSRGLGFIKLIFQSADGGPTQFKIKKLRLNNVIINKGYFCNFKNITSVASQQNRIQKRRVLELCKLALSFLLQFLRDFPFILSCSRQGCSIQWFQRESPSLNDLLQSSYHL